MHLVELMVESTVVRLVDCWAESDSWSVGQREGETVEKRVVDLAMKWADDSANLRVVESVDLTAW